MTIRTDWRVQKERSLSLRTKMHTQLQFVLGTV
jgi:hypothetical protein